MTPLVTVEKIVLGGLASRRASREAASVLPAWTGHCAKLVRAALNFDCYVVGLQVFTRGGSGTLWGNHDAEASLSPQFAQYRDLFEQLGIAAPVGRAGERS